VWEAAGAEAVQEWARQDRALEDVLARNAFRGPRAQGFIQTWLLLLPIPYDRALEDVLTRNAFRGPRAQGFIQTWLLLLPIPYRSGTGDYALDRQQIPGEAGLRPKPGQAVVPVGGGRELVWREHRSPEAVLNFNAVLGQMTQRSVAYAACYLESDRERNDLWLQVGSDDQAKVYLNGREIYQYRFAGGRWLEGLDTIGPVVLKQGTNVLLFKVVNEYANWEGCVRLVDEAGRPAEGIRVKLTP
jgi:hypothetical protein